MKTTINKLAAAAIFAFILLAGNVRAEGNDATASSLESVTEATMQLENWMTDESLWNVTATKTFAVDMETEMEIENWMIDDSTWAVTKTQNIESENSLQLEGWMTNKNIWNI